MNLNVNVLDVGEEEVNIKVELARDEELESLKVVSDYYPE